MKRLDDRGSMPLAMLVVLVGVLLSATLGTIVITQVRSGDFNARRTNALHAAQAGLDAGLAQVRASVNSAGEGDTALLPCGPLTGTMNDGSNASYAVTLTYFGTDPQGKSDATLATEAITCANARLKNPGPQFVMFTSTGTATKDRAATRQVRGTYIVHTDNTNISGALIHVYRNNSSLLDLCMDAGSAEPAPGKAVTMQSCSAGLTSQTWAYAENLQIVLVASQTPSRPFGMCIDAGGYARATSNPVLMQPCQAEAPALFRQQWSFNDSANLVGSNSTGTNTDGFCINVKEPNKPGSELVAIKTCAGGYNNVNTFSADAAVGAGQAGSQQPGRYVGQLINYHQFGRCLDDTGQNPNATHMIAWPCKQNPNPTLVAWNQRYALPRIPSLDDPKMAGKVGNKATGTITTVYTPTGITYCLQSPLTPALYQYVTTKLCSGGANQQWTVYGHTNQYATSYTIVDSTGKYCLQPRDPDATTPDIFQAVNKISKIYVGVCSGTTLQKWNADKNVVDAMALKDVVESPQKAN